MNCCVAPTAKLAGLGVTAIELSVFVAAVTVRVADPLTPLSEAVIVDDPAATPVASPPVLMVAAAVFDEVQVTVVVTLPVVPLL